MKHKMKAYVTLYSCTFCMKLEIFVLSMQYNANECMVQANEILQRKKYLMYVHVKTTTLHG